MDPFSVTVGCVSLLGAVTQAITRIAEFTKSFQDARSELISLHSHLEQLQDILELLYHDSSSGGASGCATTDADDQIKDQINNCLDILDELGRLVDSYRGSWVGRWALTGKPAAENIGRVLEGCIDRLQLAVNIRTSPMSQQVTKKATTDIIDSQLHIDAQLHRLSEHLGLVGNYGPAQQSMTPSHWLLEDNKQAALSDEVGPGREPEVRYFDLLRRLDLEVPCVINAEKTGYSPYPSEGEWSDPIMFPNWQGEVYQDPATDQYSSPSVRSDSDWSQAQSADLGYASFAPRERSSTMGSDTSYSTDMPTPKPTDPADDKIREEFKQAIWASTGKLRKGTNPIAEKFKEMVQLKAATAG